VSSISNEDDSQTKDVITKKERKVEGDLSKNMNCFSQHLVDDSCFKKKNPQTFFSASMSFSSKPFKP